MKNISEHSHNINFWNEIFIALQNLPKKKVDIEKHSKQRYGINVLLTNFKELKQDQGL